MGNKLFGIDISKLVKDNIGPGVLSATLTKSTPGTRTVGSLTAGTQPTTTDFTCRGFIDLQAQKDMQGTLVSDGTKMIILIGDTINGGATVPEVGDQITIEGTVYKIEVLNRDPAAATYTTACRPV